MRRKEERTTEEFFRVIRDLDVDILEHALLSLLEEKWGGKNV